MRRASDLPGRHRSRWRTSGRFLLIGVIAAMIGVIVFGRAVARFYIDWLWFDALGQGGVFWGMLRAKVLLFLVFFGLFALLAVVNMVVADRLAPRHVPANVHPVVERFHEAFGRRLRVYRYGFAAFAAFIAALPATGQWEPWVLYRNRRSFGVADAQFNLDVGFYVFDLPFVGFLVDWLFAAVIVVLVLTLLTHVLNGAVVFASPMPSVSTAMKGHLAVLLALLAAVKAADYWVGRYEATNAARGFVQGPTYSVVHAQLPALVLLAVVAVITAGLFLSTLRTQSWRVPLVASGVWLVLAIVGGYVYPAAIQSLVVRPNQKAREAPHIEHNVVATRQAMGLGSDDVRVVPVDFGTVTATQIEESPEPLAATRLLSPVESRNRFVLSEGEEAGLTIADLDVDRYEIDGEMQQVIVGARELDVDGAPNQSWQGRHLINTHGCGVVMAPASSVRANGHPAFFEPDLDRPELYFSPSIDGWAVARTDENERGCGERVSYEGGAGVAMSSWARRAAFALAFMDYNVLGSGSINADSQMLWTRNVRDRVERLAPFLTFDGDPYPVVVDGKVQWVIDAYTSTSRYPYAEAVGNDIVLSDDSGVPRDANYIRNSVKAVVDAYDGTVEFYVIDEGDPIVMAWWSAFPSLFTPGDEMDPELRAHLRYPEDLFRVQTDVYSKYQLAPEDFFDRIGAWSVAQAPPTGPRDGSGAITAAPPVDDGERPAELATDSANLRFIPYYTMFHGVDADEFGSDEPEFALVRPFVPFSRDDRRTELQAFMTASSDPDNYGALTVYVHEGATIEGPRSVASTMDSDADIAQRVSLLSQTQSGTSVRFGDLQLVPIGDGVLWVRPFYIDNRLDTGPVASVTDYQYVIVVYRGRAAFDTTLGGALESLFPSIEGLEIGERTPVEDPFENLDPDAVEGLDDPDQLVAGAGDDDDVEMGTDRRGTPVVPTDGTSEAVLLEVLDLLQEADEALAAGDLGTYQAKVREATDLLASHTGGTDEPGADEPGADDDG